VSPAAGPRVLVFDSGIGGLSVADCIARALPGVQLVYLADNAGFPYGDKPEPVVVRRCCELIRQCLSQMPCDVVVVACNTASTIALPSLRSMIAVPVVGVVPAIKPAAACSINRRIGLLATPATVRRRYLDQLVAEFASDCDVVRVGHPELVCWAEKLVTGHPPHRTQLQKALAPLAEAAVDTVVLGCTHYPLLLPWLRPALPDVDFWVDSGDAIARRVGYWLAQQALANPGAGFAGSLRGGGIRACFTGRAPCGLETFMAGMGLAATEVSGNWPGVTAAGSA